jgi:hypothetical protein
MEDIEKVYNQALEKHGEDIKDFYIYISSYSDYNEKTYKGLPVIKFNVLLKDYVAITTNKVSFTDEELLAVINY